MVYASGSGPTVDFVIESKEGAEASVCRFWENMIV
jgi:hypothetical protein